MRKESRAHAAMGGKKSSKKHSGKKVVEIHIRPGKSGGFIVKHDIKPDKKDNTMMSTADSPSSEEHVVPDMPSLLQHIQDHTPTPDGSDEEDMNPQPQEGGQVDMSGGSQGGM